MVMYLEYQGNCRGIKGESTDCRIAIIQTKPDFRSDWAEVTIPRTIKSEFRYSDQFRAG